MNIQKIIVERAGKLPSIIGMRNEIDYDSLKKRADRISEGYVYFCETEEVFVGLEKIDWTGPHIKHQEWPMQLNRFYILQDLVAAYQRYGDIKYAETARAYIEDWIKFRNGEESESLHHGDNPLNVSVRIGNSCFFGWGACLTAFLYSTIFDDAFIHKALGSIERQANYLFDHLRSDGNWRICQLDSLVLTALRFPFFKKASEFLSVGSRGLHNAFKRQMLADGVHEERAPMYHEWMTKIIAKYFLLKKLFPEQLDMTIDRDLLEKTIAFGSHSALSGLNDSRIILFGEEKQVLERYRNLSIECGLDLSKDWKPANDAVYPEAGFVFFNSKRESLAFDAGKSDSIGSNHVHCSRLSLSYRVDGHLLIADPGIMTYETSDPFMAYGKSTPAHSTLNLNGFSQANIAEACLRDSFAGENFALAHASYTGGYWPGKYFWIYPDGRGAGVFGRHHRIVFQVKNEYVCVFDFMLAEPGNTVNNCWQFSPMASWDMDERNLSWQSNREQGPDLFMKMLVPPPNIEIKCYEGEREPKLRGWVGGDDDNSYPAPLVEFSCPSSESTVSAILFTSFKDDQAPNYQVIEAKTARRGNIQYFAIETPDGNIDHIAWSPMLDTSIEEGTPLFTDSPIAYLRKNSAGETERSFTLDGTYLDFIEN